MSLDLPLWHGPPTLKTSEGWEPTKMLMVVDRLSKFAETQPESGPLVQVIEDVRYLLQSHLDYYQRYEKAEREKWYHISSEGDHRDISWECRAKAFEKAYPDALRYKFLQTHYLGALLDLIPTCDTCDVGLDYAIDKKIEETEFETPYDTDCI